MAFSFGGGIVRNGLVLYLDAANTRSYPGTGTVWNDLSISGNNGTLVNGPTFSSANGGSIVFDGVDDYIDLGNILNFERTNPFSISCWINVVSLAAIGAIFTKAGYIPNITGYYFGYETTGDFTLILRNTLNINQILVRTPTGQIIANRWTHLSVTYNGNSLANGVSLYTNGNLQSNVVATDNLTGTIITPVNVNIAARTSTSVSKAYLNGRIAQTMVYNRALSASEVAQNYNALKSRFGLS